MQSEFVTDFAQPRAGQATQLYAYALLGMAAAIFFLALFLHIPVGTEARDYLFYRGYLAQGGSWRDLIFPVGTNHRLVSMAVFAFSRDACGFSATCVNTVQIFQLLLCVLFGAIHLHQLLRRPVLVACCMALWCFSLPVFASGFWQATQHDKLACLFSLAALSFGLSIMRREVNGVRLAAATAMLLTLFVLALNAKEIAFFLPVAAIAQIALLGATGSTGQRVRAARVYMLPLAYAVFYIAIYVLRLNAAWRGHVMGGDLAVNALYYFLGLMGRQGSGILMTLLALSLLLGALCAAAVRRQVATGGLQVSAYLAVILAGNLALVARAQYPDNFYLIIAEWAFLGLVAVAFVMLRPVDRMPRIAGLGAIAVLLAIFLHKRVGQLSQGGWELLREAHVLEADYGRLQPYCGAQMAQGITFDFVSKPPGLFYFFRGGSDGAEPLLAAFICETEAIPHMTYRYDGISRAALPGELQVSFNTDLSIQAISKK